VGSARILTALGFPALATTSAGLAFSLGRRDAEGAVTREEALANAQAIVLATHLPVSADLENGFGHRPKEVAETIRRAAAIGLVGGSIEDATADAAHPIHDFGLAVERVAASVEAARSLPFPFTLTARAENFLFARPDLDDTIARLRAFEAAGADVLYAPGLPDLAAIREVCGAVSRPVNVVIGLSGQSFTIAELQEAGVKRISLGSALARIALGGLMRAAREILDRSSFGFCEAAMSFGEANSFMA
jgi:2-methylisocitrate lyase-like PEP mutase family enzyme